MKVFKVQWTESDYIYYSTKEAAEKKLEELTQAAITLQQLSRFEARVHEIEVH
jgi:hypothetical protein